MLKHEYSGFIEADIASDLDSDADAAPAGEVYDGPFADVIDDETYWNRVVPSSNLAPEIRETVSPDGVISLRVGIHSVVIPTHEQRVNGEFHERPSADNSERGR